jgi:hypothetical protein
MELDWYLICGRCCARDGGYPPGETTAVLGRRMIRIVLEGLRGEASIAELFRKEGKQLRPYLGASLAYSSPMVRPRNWCASVIANR